MKNEPTFFIYALTDPDGSVRYVGQTSQGMRRPRQHLYRSRDLSRRDHRGAWIRSLTSVGAMYGVEVLELFADRAWLNFAEARWIAHGRNQGWRLTNHTDGGDGCVGRIQSDETKKKMSAATTGRIISDEWRRNISIAGRGRKCPGRTISRERAEKTAATLRGRKLSAEHSANISAGKTGKKIGPRSAEARAKVSVALTGRVRTPEHCAALSASAKKWHAAKKAAQATG